MGAHNGRHQEMLSLLDMQRRLPAPKGLSDLPEVQIDVLAEGRC